MENEKQKTIFTVILLVILVTTSTDVWLDLGQGSTIKHLMTEIIVCVAVVAGLVMMWSSNKFLKLELQSTQSDLAKSLAESMKWKNENAQLISGLSGAIDKQLSEWHLSPSEKDVALMLLKGLSLKEIAEIRSVSERTVRQQSINVYQKANIAGRAELSAFFLEDLLK
jgi:DNA-binding CsgD family transcriptional regulator/uncharacterized integral membrane protein